MKQKLILLGVCLVLVMSSAAFADNVYVTKNGKKFHTATCPLTQNKTTTAIDEQEAEVKGYKPCSKCFKDKSVQNKKVKQDIEKLSKKSK